MINKFENEFRFLSNFFPCQILYEGITYPSTEHAYQAAKSIDIGVRNTISKLSSPGQSKAYGRHLNLRPDWDNVKDKIMEDLLRLKFQNPQFKKMLLATNDEELEEGNTWNDTYWGTCNGIGQNKLGKLLMKIREEIK